MIRNLVLLFTFSMFMTLTAVWTGVDLTWAAATYNAAPRLAMWAREFGPYPAIAVSIGALAVLALSLIPQLRSRLAFWRQLAAVWVLTLAIGSGLIVNMLLKEYTERPRPRDVIELGGGYAYREPFTLPQGERGKSFPSGHATMGFIFSSLYFPLRRLKRKDAAINSMTIGLVFGGLLGLGRMLAGAHFFTDVIWAGTIMIATAYLVDAFMARAPKKWTWFSLIPALILLTSALTLVRPIDTQIKSTVTTEVVRLNVPCTRLELRSHDAPQSELTLHITGLGAPRKGLKLHAQDGTFSLEQKGYYHDLSCQALLLAPKGTTVEMPSLMALSIIGTILPLAQKAEGWQRLKLME